jgi:crotonobetaine/carnitine-CoA ligase
VDGLGAEAPEPDLRVRRATVSGERLRYLDLTLNSALERAVATWPERTFLRIDQTDVTFAEFNSSVGRLAAGLANVGVRRGDRVCVFMKNSLACEHTWFATNRLGAVWAPINTDFRGVGLKSVVEIAEPKLLICDADLRAELASALPDAFTVPILTYGDTSAAPDHRLEDCYRTDLAPVEAVSYFDSSALLFTSGTTGRSKAALLSHRYFVSQASIAIVDFGLHEYDVLYCPFPLFHADATALTTVPALLLGCVAAIGRRFSASGFWTEVRETKATVFDFMGATLSILRKAEPRPDDADNPVRLAWGVPVPDWAPEFEKRFGLQIIEVYGSVEANVPVVQRFDQMRVVGSCGRVIPEFDVIAADDHDQEVPGGEIGELLVRPRIPYTTMTEYFGMPEATVNAGRNFWFHSGDLGRIDADGNVYFEGRTKEAIRRRGENISAFEVEEGILQNPGIVECAVIGVPSDLTEEDVKACVVLRPGVTLSEREILEHCQRVLGRFQIPRYIEVMDALPKTPTGKLEKYRLKEEAFTSRTWDRETKQRIDLKVGRP